MELANPMVINEWPDPQFCIQDANAAFTAMNDALAGTIDQIEVTNHTVGSSIVICQTRDTRELQKGNLLYFSPPADPALRGYALRVVALTPNVSFTVVTGYASGVPGASAACSVNVVQRGAFESRSGNVTSNVQRGSNGAYPRVWISDRRAHISLLNGCMRVLVVSKSTDETETIYWHAPRDRLPTLAGARRAVGLAVHVVSGVGASAAAFFNTGSVTNGGSNSATSAARTWVSGQMTVPVSPAFYQAGVQLKGPAGSTFVLGEFTEGASDAALPDGSFSTPSAQFIRSLSSLSPWAGARLTTPASGGFLLDMQQTSNGVINGGVSILTGLLEGQSQTVGAILSTCTSSLAPANFNPPLHQGAIGPWSSPAYYAFSGGNFNMASTILEDPDYPTGVHFYPTMHVFGTPSVEWRYLSWDIHGAILFAGP